MPLLGHAFVGLATGLCAKPREEACLAEAYLDEVRPPPETFRSAMWLPAIITLAYLPDIIAWLLLPAGWSDTRVMSHSILFAFIASVVVAPLLCRMAFFSFQRSFSIALFSILFHDLLDIAQSTDRTPWWPFSESRVGDGFNFLPTDTFKEAILFGLIFLLFWAGRRFLTRRTPKLRDQNRYVWIGRATIAAIMLTAVAVHQMRDARERQLDKARSLANSGDYSEVLKTLKLAERWPSIAKPGRIDYLKAESFAGLGDRRRAEENYLRSYEADPDYFWCVVDLAVFYAAGDQPSAERNRLVAPYLARLQNDFANHKDLPRFLAKIKRKLNEPTKR